MALKGKYWIIDLADDYSCAVVSNPNRKYLWILSRTHHNWRYTLWTNS
ncbi:MAG: lipocalin family protein [Saprospiraceae bacterium]|nr:lipocalin family protein [Candidatus Vicinibacter affinis]